MSGSDQNHLKMKQRFVIHSKSDSYLVEEKMGEGSFGKVVRCKNLNTDEIRAIKVPKLNTNAGTAEEKALTAIRQLDADKTNLIKFYEGFTYKGRKCLVFEFLSESLFDLLEDRNLHPLHVSEIRVITQQLLVALDALKSIGFVHCDIKPDNIMLVNHTSQPFKVKLIDFGNAMKTSTLEKVQMIQALGYRAPEVVLGLPLNEAVDVWALGCVLAYVFIGRHIYPLQFEYEFIRVLTELQGFPDEVLSRGSKVETFFTFTEDSCWKLKTKKEYKEITGRKVEESNCIDKYVKSFDELSKLHPGLDDSVEETDIKAFMSLLKRMLQVNPAKRITPREALGHHFITMAHLSSKSGGPYITLAHANMRESQLEEAVVERFETSSETVGLNSSATPSADHQPEGNTEHEEKQSDIKSQEETLNGIERSCKSMAVLQEYKKHSCETGRIVIRVRPRRSTEEASSAVTKQIQPVVLKRCSTNTKPPNPTRYEAIVTPKVSKASPKAIKTEPAPDKRPIKSNNADENVSCSVENRCDIAEGKSNQTCLERMQNFFIQICECCRRNK